MRGDVVSQELEGTRNQIGIEVPADATSNFIGGFPERDRRVVGSFVDHCINGINDREDAGTGLWSILTTNIVGTGGEQEITSPANQAPKRFYRVGVKP